MAYILSRIIEILKKIKDIQGYLIYLLKKIIYWLYDALCNSNKHLE